MHALTVGQTYCLRLPDGRSLGHVHITERDDLWASGAFTPAPGFEDFRALFAEEAELRRDQVIPLWEEAYDAIEALNIQVVGEGNAVIQPELRVFVDDEFVSLGMPLPRPNAPLGLSKG